MTNFNLDTMPLEDLRKLRKDVEKAINSFQARKKAEARAKVEDLARGLGFSFSELADAAAPKTRKPAKPKYANPANSEQTWTGRGRKPQWAVDWLARGKALEDLKIGK